MCGEWGGVGGWAQSSIKCVKVIPLSVLEIPLSGLPGTSHHFIEVILFNG